MKSSSKLWLCGLTLVALSTSARERIEIRGEGHFNDPNQEIECPAGTEKRTTAVFYRELDPEWTPETPFPPPPEYSAAQLLEPPRLAIPRNFLGFPKSGFSSVAISIDAYGKATSMTVVCSTGTAFDKAALDAIPMAVFSPATLDGVPIVSVAILPFQWERE